MKTKLKIFSDASTRYLENEVNNYAKDNNCIILSVSIAAKPNGDYYLAAVLEEKEHEQVT